MWANNTLINRFDVPLLFAGGFDLHDYWQQCNSISNDNNTYSVLLSLPKPASIHITLLNVETVDGYLCGQISNSGRWGYYVENENVKCSFYQGFLDTGFTIDNISLISLYTIDNRNNRFVANGVVLGDKSAQYNNNNLYCNIFAAKGTFGSDKYANAKINNIICTFRDGGSYNLIPCRCLKSYTKSGKTYIAGEGAFVDFDNNLIINAINNNQAILVPND